MKNIITVLLFCVFLYGCKKDAPVEQTSVTDTNVGQPAAVKSNIKVEDSNVQEFEQGISDALSGEFEDGVFMPDSMLQPPITIVTQNKKLIFKSINPFVEKGYYDEDLITYTSLGYSERLKKHMVYVQYYEGNSYFLIDHATAKIDTINGRPDFSPDRKNMISYYVSPYNEGESLLSAEVEIYSVVNNHLAPLYNTTYDFIPYEIKWKGNDTILVKALSAGEFYDTQTDTINKKTPHFFYKRILLK